MAVDEREFKAALGRFASGVTVVTVGGPSGDAGITVSAFCSVSLRPPLVLACIQKDRLFHSLLSAAKGFAVNLLGEGQRDLSERFAGRLSMAGRFAGLSVERASISGAPLLPGCLGWLDCRMHARHDGGDHTIFVGEVEAASLAHASGGPHPLLHFLGRYGALRG